MNITLLIATIVLGLLSGSTLLAVILLSKALKAQVCVSNAMGAYALKMQQERDTYAQALGDSRGALN